MLFHPGLFALENKLVVLWIRIRMNLELLPGSGSGSRIIVPDPDPAKYEKQKNKNVISLWILDCMYCRTGRYLVDPSFWLNLKVFLFYFQIKVTEIILLESGSWSAWIRNFGLDPNPELGKFKAGSGSGINHYGSTTLLKTITFVHYLINIEKY